MSGNISSKKKKYISLSVIILGVAFLWALDSFLEHRFSSINQKFEDKLKQHLQEMGDTVKVADMHPGNWSKVCVFGVEGDSFGSVVSYYFQRAINQKIDYIQYINHLSGYRVTEDEWAIMFVYPPNKVEYFVTTFTNIKLYLTPDERKKEFPFCEEREKAIFVNVPLSERPKYELESKYEHKIFLSLRSKDE